MITPDLKSSCFTLNFSYTGYSYFANFDDDLILFYKIIASTFFNNEKNIFNFLFKKN